MISISDLCHSLSYDEAFVSRRPRLYFFSQTQTKPSSSLPAAQSRNGPPNQVPKRADKPLPQEPPEPPQARQEARLEGRSTSHEPWLKESPRLFGRQYAAFLRRRRGRRKQHPYGRRERTGEELDPYEEDARFRQLDVERQRQPIIRPRRQMVGRHRQSARKPQAPNGGMRGIVVNIPGLRRPRLQLSRVVVAPGSFDEEDTASVSSAGGSVKSHRSTAKEAESSSDQRAGIEIPYWHRLHTGPGDESAVMHLSSHRFANSGDPEARDTPSNHRTLPEEAKEDGKSLEVPSYQLVMLEKPRNGNEVEDTSDLAYVQRHKSAEMFERSTNYPSRGRPGNKAPARGDLSVHPGEFLGWSSSTLAQGLVFLSGVSAVLCNFAASGVSQVGFDISGLSKSDRVIFLRLQVIRFWFAWHLVLCFRFDDDQENVLKTNLSIFRKHDSLQAISSLWCSEYLGIKSS